MDHLCPTCGYRRRHVRGALARRLETVGHDWTVVREAASRWYARKLAARYPQFEFRHTRTSLLGGRDGAWRIEARRKPQ